MEDGLAACSRLLVRLSGQPVFGGSKLDSSNRRKPRAVLLAVAIIGWQQCGSTSVDSRRVRGKAFAPTIQSGHQHGKGLRLYLFTILTPGKRHLVGLSKSRTGRQTAEPSRGRTHTAHTKGVANKRQNNSMHAQPRPQASSTMDTNRSGSFDWKNSSSETRKTTGGLQENIIAMRWIDLRKEKRRRALA